MNKFLLIILVFVISLFAQDNLEIKTGYYITKDDLTLSKIKQIQEFTPSLGDNFGVINKNCWLKLEIKNNTNKIQIRVFKFRFPYMDNITVYKDDDSQEKYGRTNNYNKHIKSIDNNIFKVNMGASQNQVIYIKIFSSFTIKTFLENYSEEEYINNIFFQKMLFYFCYGILFSLILYNFFVWYTIKIKVFLYYVLFHFIFLLGIISWTGFGFEFIWPDFPIFNYYSFGIIGNLVYGFQVLFIITYLNSEAYLPKLTSFLRWIAYLFFFFSVTSIFIQLTMLYEILSIISAFLLLYIICYLLFVKKLRLAFYILISELIILSGNFFMVLSDMGLTKGSFFMDYFFVWGACVEVILMSFALAYKYKHLEREKDKEKLKRIEAEEMIISKHKLATLGEMLNNLVHQWRQPLSQINSVVYSIENDFHNKKLDAVNLDEKLNSIEFTTKYLSQTINDFRNFSASDNTKSKFLIEPLIDEVLSIMNFTIKLNEINIDVKYSNKNIDLDSSKNELSQVLMVILTNAKDAIAEKKIEKPEIKIEVIQDIKNVSIKISNNAGAIPMNIINKIFEPYFTTKAFEEGTGLGLYIAKLIVVDRLDATISVTTFNNWTTFIIKM